MPSDSTRVEVVVLGSGTSHGVPMIGCDCATCTSDDPRDRRTRPSIFVHYGGRGLLQTGKTGDPGSPQTGCAGGRRPLEPGAVGGVRILVDTSPELRLQCLAHGIDGVDAVLFTHHHADHVAGLDDLRRFNWIMKRPMPCYGAARTIEALRRMFAYAFEAAPDSPHSRPQLDLREITDQPFTVANAAGTEEVVVVPIPLFHGPMPVLGFRFGRFAYCTDCSTVPDESLALLRGLDVLILDALRPKPHPTHLSVDQAVELAGGIGAPRTYFTHMAHQLKHAETNAGLPKGMELAYDGLRFCA